MTDTIPITIANERFEARFEPAAPRTAAALRALFPYRERLIHVRWSGEACWIPMGDHDTALPYENATSYPAPGQIILHPGPAAGSPSETEILIAYGPCCFASKAGQLAGNHVLTITNNLDRLATLGRKTLQDGAQPIQFGD